MQIVYSSDTIPSRLKDSIFLAGPTPRDENTKSWRPDAISLFEQIGFPGILVIPEYSSDKVFEDYMHQVQWEEDGLTRSSVIMFWVPRNMDTLPGMTTNVEFGLWVKSGKVIYGRPDDAENIRYLDWVYRRANQNENPISTLAETVAVSAAIAQSDFDTKPRICVERIRTYMRILGIST